MVVFPIEVERKVLGEPLDDDSIQFMLLGGGHKCHENKYNRSQVEMTVKENFDKTNVILDLIHKLPRLKALHA